MSALCKWTPWVIEEGNPCSEAQLPCQDPPVQQEVQLGLLCLLGTCNKGWKIIETGLVPFMKFPFLVYIGPSRINTEVSQYIIYLIKSHGNQLVENSTQRHQALIFLKAAEVL